MSDDTKLVITQRDDSKDVQALLDRYRQINSTHVGDDSNVTISGGLLKETLTMLSQLAGLPAHPHYAAKPGGPKPQKKPILKAVIPAQ